MHNVDEGLRCILFSNLTIYAISHSAFVIIVITITFIFLNMIVTQSMGFNLFCILSDIKKLIVIVS